MLQYVVVLPVQSPAAGVGQGGRAGTRGEPCDILCMSNSSMEQVKKAATVAAAENITQAEAFSEHHGRVADVCKASPEVEWCGIRAGAYGEKGMRRQMEARHAKALGWWDACSQIRPTSSGGLAGQSHKPSFTDSGYARCLERAARGADRWHSCRSLQRFDRLVASGNQLR